MTSVIPARTVLQEEAENALASYTTDLLIYCSQPGGPAVGGIHPFELRFCLH